MPAPRKDPNTGYNEDDLFPHTEPLTEMLGTDFAKDFTDPSQPAGKPWPANLQNVTYEDLLQAMGFTRPGSGPAKVTLSDTDLFTIAKAIEKKTGWTYRQVTINACCSCLPNR